jgi:hypothetical protein
MNIVYDSLQLFKMARIAHNYAELVARLDAATNFEHGISSWIYGETGQLVDGRG